MHPAEVEQALETLTIIVDTREQPTENYHRRIAEMGVPVVRRKLDFGDYSAFVTLPDGSEFTLDNRVCVERKMGLGELCNCFCQQRKRFTREFERAEEAQAKTYLLVENATWEKVYSGDYRSLMSPNALVASICAWLARYNCQLIFCEPQTTGKLIKDILYREIKEVLMKTSYIKSNMQEYEAAKRELEQMDLTPEQYEREIRRLAAMYEI